MSADSRNPTRSAEATSSVMASAPTGPAVNGDASAQAAGSPRRSRTTVDVGPGRAMAGELTLPAGGPPPGGWPAVVVLSEAFGVTQEIREVASRFADRGWAALTPDFLSTGPSYVCLVRAMREAVSGRPGPVVTDLDTARRWLADRPEVDERRITVIGFCLGGGLAMLLGGRAGIGVRAVSANYGEPPRVEALRGCAPVLAAYGSRDRMFARKGPLLRERLAAAGVPGEVTVYPTAGHSFLTEPPSKRRHQLAMLMVGPLLRPGQEPHAAAEAWERIWTWFDEHTGTEPDPAPAAGNA
ncbi:carboxymethylenebutenolidase [Frankia sp. EI5c]|uniref:dienelactone hydrolase family protein n=1 Tax=Frankia sp. EI5c TaxID=683316 RepID=UPI0007C2BA54|nr:dienelactone hydrolase family protein [Frankia sp. EI5c]OAA23229.1 carboxymethylenebutenolidase [Frankia sp. EI5c]